MPFVVIFMTFSPRANLQIFQCKLWHYFKTAVHIYNNDIVKCVLQDEP